MKANTRIVVRGKGDARVQYVRMGRIAVFVLAATVLGTARGEQISFTLSDRGEIRLADAPTIERDGATYVPLDVLVNQFGGAYSASPDRVQVDLAGKTAWLRLQQAEVNASLGAFSLTRPLLAGDDGAALMALADLSAFFDRAFRATLSRAESRAPSPAQDPPEEADDDGIAEALTPLDAGGTPPLSGLDEVLPVAPPPPAEDSSPEKTAEASPLSGLEEVLPDGPPPVAEGSQPEKTAPPSAEIKNVPPPPEPVFRERPVHTVIVDAGHGGDDVGCAGSANLAESMLVLAIAQRLVAALEATGSFKAALTRDRDVYSSRSDRIARANAAKGDLFVSLHAAASFTPAAHGMDLFCCASKAAGAATGDEVVASPGLAYAKQSRAIADAVADALVQATGTTLRGVHETSCALLKDADMPGVLIEIGFLTNPAEESILQTEAYQVQIADGIAQGLKRYAESFGAGDAAQ